MAKQNYDFALNGLLKDEGGYTNHPSDPGGPTNFGITLADYRKYINKNGTAEDVKNMTVLQAKSIYKKRYWDAVDADNLPSGVDYAIFDYGVNSGVGRARKINAKYANIADPVKRINAICDERMAFLRSLRTFPVFGKGWTNRVAGVRKNSIKLATSTPTKETVKTGGIFAAIGAAFWASYHYLISHWQYFLAAGVAIAIALIARSIYKFHKERTGA